MVNMDLFHGPESAAHPGRTPRALRGALPGPSPACRRRWRWPSRSCPGDFMTHVAKEMLVSSAGAPTTACSTRGGVLVNSAGGRFTRMRTPFAPSGRSPWPASPGRPPLLVFDHRVAEQFRKWPNFIATAPGIAYAYLDDCRRFPARHLRRSRKPRGALQRALRSPKGEFRRTVTAYNERRRGGGRMLDPWGRQGVRGPARPSPLLQCWGRLRRSSRRPTGGYGISTRFEVLREDGSVISRVSTRPGRRGRGGWCMRAMRLRAGLGVRVGAGSPEGRPPTAAGAGEDAREGGLTSDT